MADKHFPKIPGNKKSFNSSSNHHEGTDKDYSAHKYLARIDISQYFSEQTVAIIEEAGEKALFMGRHQIDTEHVLYALIKNDIVQEILEKLHVDVKKVKRFIEESAPQGEYFQPEQGLSITPRVKNILENSYLFSRQLSHGYIGPEHLLAVISESEGFAGDTLIYFGVTKENVYDQIVLLVGMGSRQDKLQYSISTPQLEKYSRNLSLSAMEGKLDPLIGRNDEIESLIEILCRRTKNNPVLIGESGVGKTAIVEGLAQRIVNEDVPDSLLDNKIMELNITSIVAGSKYRGDFEERIKQILDEIVEFQDQLIIFIDELHTIVGTGAVNGEGGLDIANIIKPFLGRGELHLIGATTLSEYQKYVEKDPALERRFQPIVVTEPTTEQTLEILKGLRDKYESFHKVKINDSAIVAACELSGRYFINRHLPDKAIDLIDQAASKVRILATTRTQEMKELDKELKRLERETEYAISRKERSVVDHLERKTKKLSDKRKLIEKAVRRERGVETVEVTKELVTQVVAKLTGIPVTELSQQEKDRLLNLESKLHERVVAQEEAVSAVADAVRRSRVGFGKRNRPQAIFMFLGPTGVGKTLLAKTLAWQLFGDENSLIRIDMSEYMEKHTVARLVGAPPGYVGYQEGGQLTETVKRRPHSVILFDEIEKGHPEIFNILLQLFDEGRLTDTKGRTVDFSNTVIICTSNIKTETVKSRYGRNGKLIKNEGFASQLRRYFKPEFLNRIDEIIEFHPLNKNHIRSIVGLQLKQLKTLAQSQHIEINFDNKIIDYLVEVGFNPEYGARELKRKIQTEIETGLAKNLLAGEIVQGDSAVITYAQGKIRIEKVPITEDYFQQIAA